MCCAIKNGKMERGFFMIFMLESYLSAKIIIIVKNPCSILPFSVMQQDINF